MFNATGSIQVMPTRNQRIKDGVGDGGWPIDVVALLIRSGGCPFARSRGARRGQ